MKTNSLMFAMALLAIAFSANSAKADSASAIDTAATCAAVRAALQTRMAEAENALQALMHAPVPQEDETRYAPLLEDICHYALTYYGDECFSIGSDVFMREAQEILLESYQWLIMADYDELLPVLPEDQQADYAADLKKLTKGLSQKVAPFDLRADGLTAQQQKVAEAKNDLAPYLREDVYHYFEAQTMNYAKDVAYDGDTLTVCFFPSMSGNWERFFYDNPSETYPYFYEVLIKLRAEAALWATLPDEQLLQAVEKEINPFFEQYLPETTQAWWGGKFKQKP
ncbi:MAG: hypothetical protein J6M53_02870 [Bacteroidaceae bacterium]|nr:hypothetical protein [Bacteroidaceae bacterium]